MTRSSRSWDHRQLAQARGRAESARRRLAAAAAMQPDNPASAAALVGAALDELAGAKQDCERYVRRYLRKTARTFGGVAS